MSDGATMSAPASAWATRRAREQLERAVVVDEAGLVVGPGDAAVAVAGVLAQARVGDQDQLRRGAPDRAQRLLHDAVGRPRFGAFPVLGVRQAEQQHAPGCPGRPPRAHPRASAIDRLVVDARHRRDLLLDVGARHHEHRVDQPVDIQARLAHHAPQVSRCAADGAAAPRGNCARRGGVRARQAMRQAVLPRVGAGRAGCACASGRGRLDALRRRAAQRSGRASAC